MRFGYRFGSDWPKRLLEAIPVDLAAAVVLALAADVAVLVDLAVPIRAVVVLPLLSFLPGYAIVAAAYPASSARGSTRRADPGLDPVRRAALSFGVSLAVLPLVVLAVLATGGLDRTSIVFGLFGVVLVGAAVGTVRGRHLPPDRRARFPSRQWWRSLRRAFGASTPLSGRALNVVVAVSILIAAASLGTGLVVPPSGGEAYTDLALLSENEAGDLVLTGEQSFTAGDPGELVLEVANHEGEATTYTVVDHLERVESTGDGFRVVDREELDRFAVDVAAGGTETVAHDLVPSTTGEDLRLSYYVYRGDAPATPDAESAYRHLYTWATVDEE